ncbi:hypothetical protein CAI21_11025 [Alkalilimnicola ehrlichii]|uniref:CBS domain-containing protein n=1 Tax=Alkalilimnicola ehrlichii TaxID=351052 RepID=A0A3E0X2K2_9GAMM|nr:CBS domain-containing protein [Alkalilimnicola ehrlichii]RFA28977.1 hypothetical protein CAI21_11025 [Alkalilimnicola ehrlichii]RFA38613.1 hypothetical protein CAL65_04570 [Alkalilimnicola ehrlichii]
MLLVVDDSGRVIGTVTDQDICLRAAADDMVPARTAVDAIMNTQLLSCGVEEDVADVEHRMDAKGLRWLIVNDADGTPVGAVSRAELARCRVAPYVQRWQSARHTASSAAPH